jgi:hypothetical protein
MSYRKYSYRELARRQFASNLLQILEESGYDYSRAIKRVNALIRQYKTEIEKLKKMSQKDFLRRISRSIFGVASKDYYMGAYRRRIEELEKIKRILKSYAKNPENFKRDIEYTDMYKGFKRKAKRDLKLISKKLKHKQTDNLEKFLK